MKSPKRFPVTVECIQATPDPIEFVSKIASICVGREDAQDPKALFQKLYDLGHHSVFEHVYFTFHIRNISRVCSHQLVRHRHCSFTQRSQRYCNEGKANHIYPPHMSAEWFSLLADLALVDRGDYEMLISSGLPQEDARYILRNSLATELYLSCNLRQLMHIANERLCVKAQAEIRNLVQEIIQCVDEELHPYLVPKCKTGLIICKGCDK